MTTPVPLDALRTHLCSEDPAVRSAAMPHLVAHGAAARELAPLVARALEDPDAGVQYLAMGAFRAVGPGARDAVPDLVRMATAPQPPPMLRARALHCLGVVGAEAADAAPALLALADDGEREAIETLVRIVDAPDARLETPVLAALASDDYGLRSAVARALRDGADWLVDRALDFADAEAASESRGRNVMSGVLELAERRPDRCRAIAHRAIVEGLPGAGFATLVVQRGDGPVPPEVARGMLRAGLAGDRGALEKLAECADRVDGAGLADEARAALVLRVQQERDLRTLRALAAALAALAPEATEALPALLASFDRGLRAKKPQWYPLGSLAEALAALADPRAADEVSEAFVRASRRAKRGLETDYSSALDFQRSLGRAVERLSERSSSPPLDTEETEAERVDAEHAEARAAAERRRGTLPAIPEAGPPPPRPTVRTPRAAERAELEEARSEGHALLRAAGLRATAKPSRVVEFVEAEVRARRRARRREPAPALAALYGDALADALSWSWKLHAVGEECALAVVAPGNTHVVRPGRLVTAKLQPGTALTFALLLNMLREALPPSKRGALQELS